jgi:hypothetical protein
MIQRLRPALNKTYNLNPGEDSTPMSERAKRRESELDRIYREVFENRKSKSDKS